MQRLEIFGATVGIIALIVAVVSLREQKNEIEDQNQIRSAEVVLRSFETIRLAKSSGIVGNIGQVEAVNTLVKQGVSLRKFDFSGLYLREVNFRGTNLTGANFSGADLKDADLRETTLTDSDFSQVDFSDVYLPEFHTTGINFEKSKLGGIGPRAKDRSDYRINAKYFGGLDFTDVNLDGVTNNTWPFSIAGSELSYSTMRDVDFDGVDASFSHLLAVDLSNSSFNHALLVGADLTGGSCDGGGGSVIDDCNPYLTLHNTSFIGADLTGATVTGLIKPETSKEIFAESCYEPEGHELEIILLNCETPNRLDLKGINIKIEGKPDLPAGFTEVKECGDVEKPLFTSREKKPGRYFIVTEDSEEYNSYIVGLTKWYQEYKTISGSTFEVKQDKICFESSCKCP